jgi:acetoin reductase-like protein
MRLGPTEGDEVSNVMLENLVALITGAGSGIGKAVALRLARDGAAVVAADVNLQAAQATADEVLAGGRDAMAAQVDVRDIAAIQSMVDGVVARFGRIDILVPCAGIIQMKGLLDISESDWDSLFTINLRGVFFTLQAVAKQMVRQGNGCIVNISSISSQGARPMQAHYAAGKAGILSLTWSAAAALAPHGIRVNAICPGIVETPMWDEIDRQLAAEYGVPLGQARQERLKQIPLGRLETAEDVAGAVAFLVSPDASYITGQTLNVDGGFVMR